MEDLSRGLIAHDFLDPKKELPNHPSSLHANYYQPIRTHSFLKVLELIDKVDGYTFIDIGSGTGKALILAAEYGFKNVLGIEFVPTLCELSRKNINKFSKDFPKVKFEIIEDDFRNCDFGDSKCIFLLNDPFDDELMEEFVKKFLNHNKKYPSWIIYKNVNLRVMPSLIKLSESFKYQKVDYEGNLFEIWSPN